MIASNALTTAPVKASNMIGTRVISNRGESLGDIKDVVIDPHSGLVVYFVVAFGGFLGVGAKRFAIPFNAFDYSVAGHEYVLDVAREVLESAPGFPADQWPNFADEKWNRSIHAHFDQPPYWD
jgi:sporulation protein YlmC with PRC-barrel domain